MSQRRSRVSVAAGFGWFLLCTGVAASLVVNSHNSAAAAHAAERARTMWNSGAPAVDLAVLPPVADEPPTPDGAKLQRSLDPLLADPALGRSVNAQVLDLASGRPLAGRNGDTPSIPASTIKLATAAAALSTLGPTRRFTTHAVAGAAPGEVVLIGGGDATLMVDGNGVFPPGGATLVDLAEQVKRALGSTPPSQVTLDASVFAGPPFGPWDPDIPGNGVVSQIVGLMTNGGRLDTSHYRGQTARVAEPDLAAAQAFASLLGIGGHVVRGTAPAKARELGAVQSLPLERQVEIMLTESDNVIAETLLRQVAIKRGKPATFEGGAAAATEALTALGLPAGGLQQYDGSGLARIDRVPPSFLARILGLAASGDHPELRPILSGLAVSGYSGTLAGRFRKPGGTAPGVVRAKTGTLRSVSSIAGVVTTADGRQIGFAVLADDVPVGGTVQAQEALDRIVAAIVACGCR